MPQLRVLIGHQSGRIFVLDARPTIIGREPTSGIILDEDSPASRRHAEIFYADGEWMIRDLASRNGTLVNGIAVQQVGLNHHDEIVVGENVFVFEYNDRSTAETEAAASRANPPVSRGLQNVPATRALVKSVAERAALALGGEGALVRGLFSAILAGGHCLLVGIPAAKRAGLVDAVVKLLHLKTDFLAITPTTSRHEVTGTDMIDQLGGGKPPVLLAGPIFSHLFVAENINAASAPAKAAILAAMTDKRLALTEQTWSMLEPFCVLATEGSGEQQPVVRDFAESFLFSFVQDAKDTSTPLCAVMERLLSTPELVEIQALIQDLSVEDKWMDLAVRITCSTRPTHRFAPSIVKRCVVAGAGPNAALALLLGAKTNAILAGRFAITLGDIQCVALPVLRHRIVLGPQAASEGTTIAHLIRRVVGQALLASE